ncbi:CFEM domain-containing protein [Annulohypoxylon stygium]|nr:CFEM domain-containing protein [Annulohypoxylon stygium]
MKAKTPSILFVLAMLASLALGQIQELPNCALSCLTSAALNSTCAPTNTSCTCADATFQGQAYQCVAASCTVREQLTTLNITNAQCGIFTGHDRSWVAPMIFFIVLAGIIFILRLVSRIVCHTKLWWDDFFNLLATIGCVGYSVVCFVTGNLGLGTEFWSVPQENIPTLLTLSYVEFIIYNWCEVTLRTSVLLFYTRVFVTGTGPRRTFWTVLIVSDILSVGFLLFNIFQCTPINYFWLRWDGEHEGHCIDANKVTLSGGVIDLFWTVLILVIPLPHILRLKLPPHKKFAATVMFAWGICTIAIMGYRFTTLEAYNVGSNPSIDGIGVTLWSGLELDVALICACMPSVYPLFLRVIHHGRQPPARPAPSSSVATIGGSGGKLAARFKRRGPWSYPSMTRLTTNVEEEDTTTTTTKWPSGECVELDERLAHRD